MTQIDNFGVVWQKTALRALKCFMKKKKNCISREIGF